MAHMTADVLRFVLLIATALAAGMVVRAVATSRDPAVALLLLAGAATAAPTVYAHIGPAPTVSWQLVSVTVGMVAASVALALARRPGQRMPHPRRGQVVAAPGRLMLVHGQRLPGRRPTMAAPAAGPVPAPATMAAARYAVGRASVAARR